MFDATTAALLRSAPAMPGLNPEFIPALLTAQYANLAAARIRGEDATITRLVAAWSLERLADTYELLTSLTRDTAVRRPAAFVAATAQQILARRQLVDIASPLPNIDRDRVDPALAAALLFLSAEQYADANEAANAIRIEIPDQLYEARILSEHIADLARGRLGAILTRSIDWRRQPEYDDLETRALASLLETLATGIELLAAQILDHIPAPSSDRYESATAAFNVVLQASAVKANEFLEGIESNSILTYAGPHHLASLLLSTADGLVTASLLAVPPPSGADQSIWAKWLRCRAEAAPYVWPNHREAIAKQFHETGTSAVVVLPTGAGKTTVSSLKIAGVLARDKKVVFLAPTHALVDQLTDDLQQMFPVGVMGSVVSNDFDLLLLDSAQLRDIEVMTPERCLAMLSFAPESFHDVGLLVFDECHLLSPEMGRIRRALDAMLCVLGFNHVAPDADLLFLSAMVRNADDMSDWVATLTARPCVAVDLPWKPSRQARGVVIYDNAELNQARSAAAAAQKKGNARAKSNAKTLRTSAQKLLAARPFAIWGLQHNWLVGNKASSRTTPLLNSPVPLAGAPFGQSVRLTPNVNTVAAHLTVAAAKSGLKCIVFVNKKADALNVASQISAALPRSIKPTELEQARWDALKAELGDLMHAVISGPATAVPHNSSMLRLERDLCEGMFRRSDGAQAIVATPTLAQGLNLPAHLAILAGDKRADASGREDLKAHELLNAAARAGRAGHLANGLVLLIPDPIIYFDKPNTLSSATVKKLRSILPEDDHCVLVSDPLEVVLDRLMEGDHTDQDVQYTVNRFAVLREVEGGTEEPTHLFDLTKSFGSYLAHKRSAEQVFTQKVAAFKTAINAAMPGALDSATAVLATQSGLSAQLLMDLRNRLRDQLDAAPTSIIGWLEWTLSWVDQDQNAREALFGDVTSDICAMLGKPAKEGLKSGDFVKLLPALKAWVTGRTIREIEIALGGNPDADSEKQRICPRARELLGALIPRGLSFTLGLVSKVMKDLETADTHPHVDMHLIETLAASVRKGYDTPEKLAYAALHKSVLSRVQMHAAFAQGLL
ncbi:DEAD/DEAH box helicase [Bradyrhizobium sp. 25ACV]